MLMLWERLRTNSWAAFVAYLLLLGSNVCAAASGDTPSSELTIEGDSAVFLQEQNTIEYVGNVIAFMDGMRISGDRILVEMTADRIKRITTTGAPASFWQEQNMAERDTTATANTIVYLPATSLLELSGSASLTQDGNAVSSARIRYNLALGQLDAGSSDFSQERVRMELRIPANRAEQDSTQP
tara:strand:+ start:140 stop:691 length:552 start_codon:yes stop_codon:yes gene_type:complete